MTDSSRPSIALMGLGPMGAPMAHRLAAVHSGLVVWNRTFAKTGPLVAAGARAATSPADAASDIVLTVLPDLAQVESLLPGPDGLLAGWAARGIEHPILVVHGTVSPVAVAALAGRLFEEHGVRVLDAPVSGGIIGADQGTLSIMVGGDDVSVRVVDLNDDGYTGVVILDIAGTRAVLETGSISHYRWDEHTQVYFEHGWVQTWAPPLLLKQVPAEVEIYRAGKEQTFNRPVPQPMWTWSYKREAEHFVERVRSGEAFRSTAEDTRTDVRLFEEIFRSYLAQRRVL